MLETYNIHRKSKIEFRMKMEKNDEIFLWCTMYSIVTSVVRETPFELRIQYLVTVVDTEIDSSIMSYMQKRACGIDR